VTALTPVYGLPYPDALDAPCDFPEDWCAFTVAVDGVLDRFELGAQRVIPAIPIAKVMITSQVVVPEGAAFPFDTVAVDTAGWTNFDADNRIITVSRTARYSVVGAAILAPSGTANSSYMLFFNGISNNDVEALCRNTQDIGITSQSEAQTISAGTDVAMFVTRNGSSGSITIRSASLTVFWHADEERP